MARAAEVERRLDASEITGGHHLMQTFPVHISYHLNIYFEAVEPFEMAVSVQANAYRQKLRLRLNMYDIQSLRKAYYRVGGIFRNQLVIQHINFGNDVLTSHLI